MGWVQFDCATSLQNILLAVQTVVLGGTGYFVWRYTKATEKYTDETSQLREETVRQTRISVRPIALPEFPVEGERLIFRLHNCGNGCAVNVRVRPVQTERYAQGAINFGRIESTFDVVGYLAAGSKTSIESKTFADGQELVNTLFTEWFHPSRTGPETIIRVRFEDVEGRLYEVTATIAEGFDQNRLPRNVQLGSIQDLGPRRTSTPR
jgi:hypothetical protein